MKKYLVLVLILGLCVTSLFAHNAGVSEPNGKMNMMHKFTPKDHNMMKHGPEGKGHFMAFPIWMAEELELTEDQINKIDDYQDDSHKVSIDLNADIDKLQIDEKNAMQDCNYKEARKIIDQIYQKKASLAKEKITLKEKIDSVLTDDQIAKLKSLHKPQTHVPPAKHPKWDK